MFKVTAACLITFLSSVSFSNFTVKECGAVLAVARTGSLTLTQVEPTDVRGLPGTALAVIVKSLKDYWIQVSTREAIPSFGNPEGVNHYLLKVIGTSQSQRFGQSLMTLVGAVGESNLPTNFKNEIPPSAKNYITTEIFLGDITSVQLVDVPEITVSLFNQVKTDGKNFNPKRFDEKIVGVTAGDSDATKILARLSDATFPKINGKPGDFETFVSMLDQQNIRGHDLVVAYREFADENINDLIIGVLERPAEIAKVINKTPVILKPAPFANYKNLN
jgi:hypothetical protein